MRVCVCVYVCMLLHCVLRVMTFAMLLQNGRTALHHAAMYGQLPVVEALVRAGSDLAAVDEVSAGLSPRAGWCGLGSNTCIDLFEWVLLCGFCCLFVECVCVGVCVCDTHACVYVCVCVCVYVCCVCAGACVWSVCVCL